MLFYLIDNDPAVTAALRRIIETGGHGSVCGAAAGGLDALEDLRYMKPDIVLAELLLEGMDGIELIRRAREQHPELHFILLSQTSSKDMVAAAYSAGADFFLSKPVDRVEVDAVISRVARLLTLERTMDEMRALLQTGSQLPSPTSGVPQGGGHRGGTLDTVLHRLGISGDPACREIVQAVEYLASRSRRGTQITVAQLCSRFSDSPKAMEQRIRRAATAGMVNLANMGIEDYTNDTFTEYAGTLYHFEQVRREMDCIRGRDAPHGRVSVKRFLYALAALCDMP